MMSWLAPQNEGLSGVGDSVADRLRRGGGGKNRHLSVQHCGCDSDHEVIAVGKEIADMRGSRNPLAQQFHIRGELPP